MFGVLREKLVRKRGTRRGSVIRRRSAPQALWLARARRFGLFFGVVVAVLWAGAWLWLSGAVTDGIAAGREKALELSAGAGFAVENILVEGRARSDSDVILGLINIRKGDPLFALNPAETKGLLERISWVRRARVERRWPDTVYIRLEEREPLALWQEDGRLQLIDTEGHVIGAANLTPFKTLPIVSGEGAASEAPALLALLAAEPEIAAQLEGAVRKGQRRWDLLLENGMSVKLPEADPGLALRRLAEAAREGDLLRKDITLIDMREPGRITVRTRPGAVHEYKAGLKTGDAI